MRVEFGASGPLQLRTERVRLGLPAPVRILYASDLHLGWPWTARVPGRLLDAAQKARPDVTLLGGDLADRAAALPALRGLVAALLAVAPVSAVPGNHDEWVGMAKVRAVVVESGGHWLPDTPLVAPVRIDGVLAPLEARPRILCAHDPAVFPAAVAAGYDLIFAGHLHGGQCVWFERNGKQYPAAWFHGRHGLRFEDRDRVMLVSRGVADTLPLRFNCPREVILCEVG